MTDDGHDLANTFKALTGNAPLSWQTRLFKQICDPSTQWPSVIDLPTGMGKTMVMAIWLIARAQKGAHIPTRLIYVVDRRTIVDQATDTATELAFLLSRNEKPFGQFLKGKSKPQTRKAECATTLSALRDRLAPPVGTVTAPADSPLAISTLRGQLADNRQWSNDPSKPAIIIGTVDLIGSALLFSGYRSGFKTKPLHAGLLGQDSLLVLDEAHLSKPFEKLVEAIDRDFQKDRNEKPLGKPMRVIGMSATSGQSESHPFRLTEPDLNDPIINERFNAKKRLTVAPEVDPRKLNDALTNVAIGLATNPSIQGKRIVVFVRKPEDAKSIAKTIKDHVIETVDETGPKQKKVKSTPYGNSVEILTGTMRGLERDELVAKDVFVERWLNGDLSPGEPANQQPVFLISTSAGEVGFDLNADHLVGDAAPLDSWIQRLGRVNRRGKGTALVHVIDDSTADKKAKAADDGKHTFASASIDAMAALKNLPQAEPLDADTRPGSIFDASPSALRNLEKPARALTPPPTMVDLTDILLDAWSMTSITTPMPGRPAVAPWLRGIADWEPPRTEIAWRAELDLDGFADLDPDEIEEWFDTHRVLTHETLSVPAVEAAKQILARWDSFDEARQRSLGALRVIVDQAGFKVVPLSQFMKALERDNRQTLKSFDTIRYARLILPASFGGIERGKGLLDASVPEIPKDENKKPLEVQRTAQTERQIAPDVADIAPGWKRLRVKVITTDEGKQPPKPIAPGEKPSKPTPFSVELESDDDNRVQLVSLIPHREKPEFGTSQPETLALHVGKVGRAVDAILRGLSTSDDFKQAAQLAADWHDRGKNRERWQRLLIFPRGFVPPNEPMGKSGGAMKRDPRGYRHEFGSLREFTDAFNAGQLLDEAGKRISQDVFDLAAHLITSHHGRGRPHFPKGGFDPDTEPRSDAIHTESIQRFARLQRKYGWWHLAWLENLLRCADALASADSEIGNEPVDATHQEVV